MPLMTPLTKDFVVKNGLIVRSTDIVTSSTGQLNALQVNGGAAISKNIIIGSTTTIYGKAEILNTVYVGDSTDSTNTNIGSIVTLGGIGVGGSIVSAGSIKVGTPAVNSVVPAVYSNNLELSSFTSDVISTATTINLDTYDSNDYRTARYTVQIVDNVDVHVTEIVLFHNGTDVYKNEYGISTNNGQLGTFDAVFTNSTITLTFTPFNPTAMTVKTVRTSIMS